MVVDEHEVLLPDGTVGWQQWIDRHLRRGRAPGGNCRGIGRDATERKRAEEARPDDTGAPAIDASTRADARGHPGWGGVLVVNEPWRRSARSHGPRGSRHAVGTSTLSACEAAGARGDTACEGPPRACSNYLAGTQASFGLVYFPMRPAAAAWFQVHVTRFSREYAVSRRRPLRRDRPQGGGNSTTGQLLRWDDERRRIAREMHDEAAQKLFAMTMNAGCRRPPTAGRISAR